MSKLLEQIEDETLRGDAGITKYDTVDDLARGLIEANKLVGRKGIITPIEGASQTEIDTYHNALGRPEKTEGYVVPVVSLPKGVEFSNEEIAGYQSAAHSLGLTQKQFEGMLNYYAGSVTQGYLVANEAYEKQRLDGETLLRREWGVQYDHNLKIALGILKMAGEKDGDDLLERYGNDIQMIKAFKILGENMSEAALDTLGIPKTAQLSPEEAQIELDKIMNEHDPEKNPYYKEGHPDQQRMIDRAVALRQMVNMKV